MALTPGIHLGPYEITTQIGVGGMGEVYRATDTNLKRQVAIKVLPESLAADPDRLARFQREAEVLAALNHPNIAHIYGLERSAGTVALVMELVEGDDLSQRIARGAIPLDEALPIAKQIAEALEAAHEQGIIHRDLKPANIKVRADSTVKVLDFGLAKLAESAAAAPIPVTLTHSPTITTPAMTAAGMILGTAAYMSPEQVKGRPADKRSDIWAFGCVLYEMLTGKRAFKGDDVTDTLASVLKDELNWSALPAGIPAAVRALIGRCVARDRRQRIGDIATALFVLSDPTFGTVTARVLPPPAAEPPRWRRVVPLAVGIALGALITSAAWWRVSEPTVHRTVTRLSLRPPEGQRLLSSPRRMVALSANGTKIAFIANGRLFVRSLSETEWRQIDVGAGDSAALPVFSPDGEWLVFSAVGPTLKKIAVTGGAAIPVCPVPTAPRLPGAPLGMTWTDDRIVFSNGQHVFRVSENGGTPETLLTAGEDEQVESPQLLPDGRTVLFTLAQGNAVDRWEKARIVAQSLRTGERKVLIEGAADGRYVPTGHIVYAAGGVLFAVRFDPRLLEVRGGRVPLVQGIARATAPGAGLAQYDISPSGSLIYVPGSATAVGGQVDLALFDRTGAATPLGLASGTYQFPRFSHDGKRVAFGSDDGKQAVVWVYGLSGDRAPLPMTYQGRNRFPIWSRDDVWVAFQSNRDGDAAIFRQRADGTGTAERLTRAEPGTAHVPDAWSPTGDRFLFNAIKQSEYALFSYSLADKKTAPISNVRSSNPITAVFSPDGRWIAYSARTPNQTYNALWVDPFPSTGEHHQITDDDGHHPAWSRNGELFFILRPGRFAVVPVTTTPSFSVGPAVDVPRGFITSAPASVEARTYDIDPLGQKFIGVVNAAQLSPATANQIEVVLNWLDELKARVPTK